MAWSKNFDWTLFYKQLDDLQVKKYLDRLGLERDEPTRGYLDKLIFAHLCTIPFENLDVTEYGTPISILPDDIYNKIIERGRGGYCFELNALFLLLLKALGFHAYSSPCRMLHHTEPVNVPATHCCNIVEIDKVRLFCDVGYGGRMAPKSLVLDISNKQTVLGETYQFQKVSNYWSTLVYIISDTKQIPLINVSPVEFLPVDFYGANLLRSQGDTSFANRIVFLRRPNGYIAISGNIFTENVNNVRSNRELSKSEINNILLSEFNLTI